MAQIRDRRRDNDSTVWAYVIDGIELLQLLQWPAMPGRLFQPMLRKCLGILFLANVGFASAQDSTFPTTVGMAVLCLGDVEPGFFFNYLSNAKPAYKREQGAYLFARVAGKPP